MEDKLITMFIPAQILEHPANTTPDAGIEDKMQNAIKRKLSSESFTGEMKENAPRLFIRKFYFDPTQMGYNVIAQLI